MTAAEVERRRARVAQMLAAGMTAGEIVATFQATIAAAAKKEPMVDSRFLDVSRRTVERDFLAIRDLNRRKVQTITPDEMAVQVNSQAEAEHRELWATVTSCGKNPKYAAIKVGALNQLARLRESTHKLLSRLGVLPEEAVKDPTFRWLLALSEDELRRISKMDEKETEEFLARRGDIRLVS